MVPTFLQKRRARNYPLPALIVLSVLGLLAAAYVAAIAFILADRTFDSTDKVGLITLLLVTALMALGFLDRLRR